MPCESSYLASNPREEESKLVAELLVYIFSAREKNVPTNIWEASKNYYGNVKLLDDFTRQLCTICKEMSAEEQAKLIYDGRSKMARKLADWWETHQEHDAIREKKEKAKILSTEEKEKFFSKVQDFMNSEQGTKAIKKFLRELKDV